MYIADESMLPSWFWEGLEHNDGHGTPHEGSVPHSGRYKYGSGGKPFQHDPHGFLTEYRKYVASGMSNDDVVEAFRNDWGMSTKEIKTRVSCIKNADKIAQFNKAQELREKGYTDTQIGQELGGINESTIRGWFKDDHVQNMMLSVNTQNMLKAALKDKRFVDVGAGVEKGLGIKRNRLDTALKALENEGYNIYDYSIFQLTNPGKKTNTKILARPDDTWNDMVENKDQIQSLFDYYSDDLGETFNKLQPPKILSRDRIGIVYAEDGGGDRDGLIELRRGCEDLTLGKSNYAQVRIKVDGDLYLKGMAVYSDDLPDGVDVRFNTSKSKEKPFEKVLKELDFEKDPQFGFGATIKANGQTWYVDEDGNKTYGLVNKVNEQGDWGEWAKEVSSQMLAKQPVKLIESQLNKSYKQYKEEYDSIMAIENPEIRKAFLESFSDDMDTKAVHLRAVGFEGQASHVLLPAPSLKSDEIYAPDYEDGTKVALIRFPHAGVFEIPYLTVNNKNKEARALIGTRTHDAVCIPPNAAQQLSGADYDGDTALVIPITDKQKIDHKPYYDELVNFDHHKIYAKSEDQIKTKDDRGWNRTREMGEITNLIQDISEKGASDADMIAVVKHSMVVIDAEKHNLDWRQSEIDNRISEIQKKYRGEEHPTAPATLVTKAKSTERGPKIKERIGITKSNTNPETGEKMDVLETNPNKLFYTDKHGAVKESTTERYRMETTNDAFTLLSDPEHPTKKEMAYGTYANKLKALANSARKEYLATETSKVDTSKAEEYAPQVKSLQDKLDKALSNAPRERQAQMRAGLEAKSIIESSGITDKEEARKIKARSLSKWRVELGSVSRKDRNVQISSKEWEAIEANAVRPTLLRQILKNCDLNDISKHVMPRETVDSKLSDSKIQRIKALANSNKTPAQIAASLGIPVSTVTNYIYD